MDRIVPQKVLLIDQNQEFLQIAFAKLSDRGFDIVTVMTGEEGIDHLKAENFDAVVLDFNKANMSGLKIINYINSLEKKPVLLPLFSNIEEVDLATNLSLTF